MRTPHAFSAASAGVLWLAQATNPPAPLPSGPRPCQPMPECLVIFGPGGANDGPLNRGLATTPRGAPMIAPSPNTPPARVPPGQQAR